MYNVHVYLYLYCAGFTVYMYLKHTVHVCTCTCIFIKMFSVVQDFYEKYQFLMGVRSSDLASQIDHFLKGMDFTMEHFQVGSTKVI